MECKHCPWFFQTESGVDWQNGIGYCKAKQQNWPEQSSPCDPMKHILEIVRIADMGKESWWSCTSKLESQMSRDDSMPYAWRDMIRESFAHNRNLRSTLISYEKAKSL